MGFVSVVNFLAKILQADTFVLWVLLDKLRKDLPHRLILVVVVFELLKSADECVPATFGNSDGEHDEERVEPGLFDDDTML